jgi:Na+/pantothenate symporter
MTLRLHPTAIDYVINVIYFCVVLGIGFVSRLAIKTDLDFFLSGRSLPAWITGLAFIAANLGALEILGQAANGAQYGIPAVHCYWIGAVPAMIFLGLFMMPFNKAAGINIDVWTGLTTLVFGGLMIFWALARPVAPEPPESRGQGSGRIRRAPAT